MESRKVSADMFEDFLSVWEDEYALAFLDYLYENEESYIMRDEYDFSKMKKRSGKPKVIPYQTLISSILHRYVTDELIDKKDIALVKRSLEKKK